MAQESALRTKYLDWCSAKIAEHIFALDPDGFWLLAQRAGEASRVAAPVAAPAWGGDEIVETLVGTGEAAARLRELILAVHRELHLPDPAEWSQLYSANPDAYDREILGFRPPRA